MHRSIKVTGGHDLESYHRYLPDVKYMVLYKPYPPDGEGVQDYQCIRLFVNRHAMYALNRLACKGQIQILYETSVREGEIYDLSHQEKVLKEIERKKKNGKSTEAES